MDIKNKKQKRADISFQKYSAKILASPEATRKYLIELGVLNENGDILDRYKSVCLPIDKSE